ncbi:MAG TPA: sialidase family protein [bacterium]|nr:sialidase family protein [bacterium]
MALLRLGVGVLALALVVGIMNGTISSQPIVPRTNAILEHSLAVETGQATLRLHERLISGGVMDAAWHARYGEGAGPGSRARSLRLPEGVKTKTLGCPNVFHGKFDNIRANQDCSFRRHAEEQIAIDPTDHTHLIAGQNDSRIGFNHCGIDYSFDRGRHWGDQLPPFWQFALKDGHVSDAASDPAMAFDSQGNVYFTCIVFDVVAAANAIVVTKSNAAFGGSFFHSPAGGPLVDNPLGIVANDNDPVIFNDKEFIAADSHIASPKRDNVYVTWTRFSATDSPIYFSQSKDGGATWSPGVEISGASSACILANQFAPTTPANRCNQDQGSWPVVGPDGTLYVFFNNGNTPTIVNQHMLVKCLGTADCTNKANWSEPVKVADDFDTQPFFLGPQLNDPVTGCPRGRQCLPPNGYRLNDFGAGAFDPNFGSQGRLYFSWSDFRNGGPCATSGGLPVEPCANHNNDVFIVHSDNGGATWSAPKLVSSDDKSGAAQWQSWMAVGPEGNVYIAYYDRQHGCESSGCNDITLAVSTNHGTSFKHFRITTASMPNLTPANNSAQMGFLGDYMSVAADSHGAVIVWADTRSHNPALVSAAEDVYFADFPLSTLGH